MRKKSIILNIETVEFDKDHNKVVLIGWGFDEDTESPLNIIDVDGKAVLSKTTKRNDVNGSYNLPTESRYGLSLTVQDHNIGKIFSIRVKSGGKTGETVTFKMNRNNLAGRSKLSKVSSLLNAMRHNGPLFALRKIQRYFSHMNDYQHWIKENEQFEATAYREEIDSFAYKPLISIVTPVYNVSERYFDWFLRSIESQYYENWELCLADDASPSPHVRPMLEQAMARDPRIKVVFREENGHISEATNSAMKIASGDFIAFIDNDDELSPHALFENVKAINANPDIDFLYSDEDKMTKKGKRVEPFFKPHWNSELLLAHNYITHFVVVRRSLIDEVGMMRTPFNGAQDYDFILRATEKARKIHHISAILYHWKMIDTSTAQDPEAKLYAFEAGKKAVQEALKRRGVEGDVTMDTTYLGAYHIRYPLKSEPLVSVIRSTVRRNNVDRWEKNIQNLDYRNIEILSTPDLISAVEQARGEFLLFANADLSDGCQEIQEDTHWLTEMVRQLQRPEIGAVTGVVANSSDQILVAGLSLNAGESQWTFDERGVNKNTIGTYFRSWLPRFIGASTLDFTLVAKEDVQKLLGALEKQAPLNGVELTVGIRNCLGKEILFCPKASLYSHTPISDKLPKKLIKQLEEKYPEQAQLDPYINLAKF